MSRARMTRTRPPLRCGYRHLSPQREPGKAAAAPNHSVAVMHTTRVACPRSWDAGGKCTGASCAIGEATDVITATGAPLEGALRVTRDSGPPATPAAAPDPRTIRCRRQHTTAAGMAADTAA